MNKDKIMQPKKFSKRDCFQTPNYATKLLLPYIPKDKLVWECAAGEGKIYKYFRENGYFALPTDIEQPKTDFQHECIYFDFLKDKSKYFQELKAQDGFVIVTNPPYSLKTEFYKKCVEYDVPFALLIPADYSLWTIDAVRKYGCEKLIPERRIDFITPTGRNGKTSSADYHSMWLTRGLELGKSETFVELSNEDKKNI